MNLSLCETIGEDGAVYHRIGRYTRHLSPDIIIVHDSAFLALGAQWLAHLLYPQDFPLDLKAETRRFYQRFLGVLINDA
ncbi:MAG: hypothetical protein LBB76_01975, partial [Azoarcus sp.]|nr:hypothetical protein [Azoarcus sp.]